MTNTATLSAGRAVFINNVMTYTAAALGVTALGVFAAPQILPPDFFAGMGMWALFGVELVLIFTISKWSQLAQPTNFLIYFAFAFISGLTLYPLLHYALAVGGSDLVLKAIVATGALSVAAGIYARTTQRDLSGMGGFLTMAIIGLIIASILQMFWFSSMMELVISSAGVVIFSAFIAYDIQSLEQYPEDQALMASMSLYLSIYNLFVSILRLLIALNSDD